MPGPLLPLTTKGPHGSRSHLTCRYRCADACSRPMPNQSRSQQMSEVIEQALARRTLLKAGAVGAGTLALSGLARPDLADAAVRPARREGVGNIEFANVQPNTEDAVTVSHGFRYDIIARWGDPVVAGAPPFDVETQTAESASRQFGYNCDYVGLVPTGRGRAVLAVNHEYTSDVLMFPEGFDEDTSKEVAIASHGMSIIEIERGKRLGSWRMRKPARSPLNRRLTGATPFRLDGAAVGDPRLATTASPRGRRVLGTLNNCSGGTTPWGTILSGEENINGYFDASGELDARYTESYARYGITGEGRGWGGVDPRFDLSQEPHEPFRFGWIVEVDPLEPDSVPRKHTMLGRLKHEGANIIVAEDRRVVAYMGDDERGEYIYKFVSARKLDRGRGRAARRRNKSLLETGTLYVARFTGDGEEDGVHDGSGTWLPLTSHRRSFVPGMSVADVLIDTRLAADTVDPTRMDRPEDIQPNPVNRKIYCALTNNVQRGTTFPVDEANPLATSMVRSNYDEPLEAAPGNRNGYVLEITERRGDHAGTSFGWDLMLVCGDPAAPETYFAGFPKEDVSPISCPDNVTFDRRGNLWVSTDGNQLGSNDGLYRVPVSGPERGHVRQFLTVPIGAETCGPLISRDQLSVFTAVQHPGELDDATFEAPGSTWPHTDPFPRPSVIVTYQA